MDNHNRQEQMYGMPLRSPLPRRDKSTVPADNGKISTLIVNLHHELEENIKRASNDRTIRIVSIVIFQSLCSQIIVLDWVETSWTLVYACMDFPEILRLNEEACTDTTSMAALQDAICLLFKYGVNLLKPGISTAWRVISFDNPLYRTKVRILKGHKQILYLYGYTKEMSYGLSYPDALHSPNAITVAKVAADLAIAYFEIDLYITGSHPFPKRIGKMIQSASRTCRKEIPKSSDLHSANAGSSGYCSDSSESLGVEEILVNKSTLQDVKNADSLLANSSYQLPEIAVSAKVSAARYLAQARQEKQLNLEQRQTGQVLASSQSPPIYNQVEIKLTKCGICKQNTANMRCDMCSQPRCKRCDELWHKHPQRQGHTRHQIILEEPEAPGVLQPVADIAQRHMDAASLQPAIKNKTDRETHLPAKPSARNSDLYTLPEMSFSKEMNTSAGTNGPPDSPDSPQHQAVFELSAEAPPANCDFCGKPGRKSCAACGETYCLECDEKRHSNQQRKNHQRQDVTQTTQPGNSSSIQTLGPDLEKFELPENVLNTTTAETESQELDSIGSTYFSVPGVAGDASYINSEEDLDVRSPPNDTYRLPVGHASGGNVCTTQPRKSPDFEESPYMYIPQLHGGGRVPQETSLGGMSKQIEHQAEQDRITAEDINIIEKLLSIRGLREHETDPMKKAELLREEQKLTQMHEEFEKKLKSLQGQSVSTQGASPQAVPRVAAIASGSGAVTDVPQDRTLPRATSAGTLLEIRQQIPAPAKALGALPRMSSAGNIPQIRQQIPTPAKAPGDEPMDRHETDPAEGWTCAHCTFLNTNMDSNICELCDKTSFPKAKIKPTMRPKDNKPELSKSDPEVKKKPATKAEIRKKNAEYYQQLEAEMLAEKQQAKHEYSQNPSSPQADPTVKDLKTVVGKSKPLSDTDLLEIAEQIPNGKFTKLGIELGFSYRELNKFQVSDPSGTFVMLNMWRGDVRKQEQRPKLKEALVNAGLRHCAYLLEENRFTEDEPRMSSPKAKQRPISPVTISGTVSDEELLQLSRKIPPSAVHNLGSKLHFPYSKIQTYLRMHLMDYSQTMLHMLHDWKIRTEPSNQRMELNMILMDSNLGGLALTEVSKPNDELRMFSPKPKTTDDDMTVPSRMSTPSSVTTSDAVSDKELLQLSKRIPYSKIHDLGFKLQFQYSEVQAYMHMNIGNADDAILDMLQKWKSRTVPYNQHKELNKILKESDLGGLALKEFVSKPKDEIKEPRGITDMELYELADSLNAGNITELGMYLGFGMAAISRYQHEAAMESPREGTRRMLFDWKNHEPETDQRKFLSNVLDQIGCGRLGEKIRNYSGLIQHHDTFEESLQKQLSHATSFGDLSYVKDEEKMRYEEMRTASLKRIAELREAESQGIHPERLKSALYIMEELGDDGRSDPIDWIAVNWAEVVHELAQKATVELRENLEVDVDAKIMDLVQVSDEAAEKCLEECSGNTPEAVKECTQRTQEKILEILEVGCHSLDDIVTILKQDDVKGDAEKALEALQVRAMKEYSTRVWTPTDEDDNEYFQKAVKYDDRSIRMLMVEYKMRSWGRADTATRLVIRNDFALDDVMIAAEECGGLRQSEEFLKQECSVCFQELPRNKLMSLINCQCMICRECIIVRFSFIARDESIMRGKCPSCDQPDLDDTAVAADYFAFLDILLREMLPSADFELFTRKLRDWNLMQDENFCWCAHCNSGFINGAPERRKMRCPECNKLTCFKCKKQWMDQHEGISCEAFQEWKENNDPDLQAQGLAAHLNENGIECPRCKMRYELAKGGCMHFKCPQCTFEFCCGCNQPMKKDCNKFASCRNKGLHAHHPRDCLFYLRDEDINFLQKLLEDAGVQYNKDPPQGAEENEEGVCGVKEQQDGPNGLVDNKCGRNVTPKNAGLCRLHYIEYLVGLINGNQIDPAKSLPIIQLETILKREEVEVPIRRPDEPDLDYRPRLLTAVQNNLPLKKSRDRPR